MKKSVGMVLLLSIVFFTPGFVSAQQQTLDSVIKALAVELKLDREIYDASEPVRIRYTLKNNSSRAVYVLKWATPLDGFKTDYFKVIQDQKKLIPYIGLLVLRIGPYPEDYVKLDANGGSITNELDLSQGYALAAAGDYKISYTSRILDVSLEKPVYKSDRRLNSGIRKIINLSFHQRGERIYPTKPADAVRGHTPPANQTALLTSPGGFSYFKEPNLPQTSLPSQDMAIVKKAYFEALKLAAGAKVVLNGTPWEEIARGVERYRAYFGVRGGQADRDSVLDVYGTIYGFGFITDPERAVTFINRDAALCNATTDIAVVDANDIVSGRDPITHRPDKYKRIQLCPAFWTVLPFYPTENQPMSQVGAVLHEMTHIAGGAVSTGPNGFNIGGYTYNDSDCIKLARNPTEEPPDKPFDNADNYHRFAINFLGLTMGLDRPHIKLNIGQGTVLAKNGGGGILDACGRSGLAAAEFALFSLRENKLLFDSEGYPLVIRNWTRFMPADGDRVGLVTTDRKHAISSPRTYAPGGSAIRAGASDAGYYTLRKSPSGLIQDGNQIALQAPNNSYLAATGRCGDGSIVTRTATGITADMKFTTTVADPAANRRYYVHLRTGSGQYLSVRTIVIPGHMDVFVSTSEPDSVHCPHCTFIFSFLDTGSASLALSPLSRYPVRLMTYDGIHFLAAKKSGNRWTLEAVESIMEPFQGFTIDHAPQKLQTGDVITLRTTDGSSSPDWRFIVEIAR